MLHPTLQQKLEDAGAHIETNPVHWEDAAGSRRVSTATFVHIPGADNQFRFFGPDYEPAPLAVSSQKAGDFEDGRDWTHRYATTEINRFLREFPEETNVYANQIMDFMAGGLRTEPLPGYREPQLDEKGRQILDDDGHRREVTVSQHWQDGLHTNLSIRNKDAAWPEGNLHLSTDPTLLSDHPHPTVLHLAREFIEGAHGAESPLADAVQENHEMPKQYARVYNENHTNRRSRY